MKILVLGHAQHGKGTFCELLTQYHGLECISSSRAALPYIAPVLRANRPGYEHLTNEDLYLNRGRMRESWYEAIRLLNTPDKAALAKLICKDYDVYDGMRCVNEFVASAHLFDRIYWVDASRREPPDPTLTIFYDRRMTRVDNNGTLEDLENYVRELKL